MAARRKGARGGKAGGSSRTPGAADREGAGSRRRSDARAKPRPGGPGGSPDATPSTPASEPPRRVAAARPVAVGRVAHYYRERGVAELALEAPIRCGDLLHIRGHTTDLLQAVERLRRHGRPVKTADATQAVTLAVAERVRPGDRLYRLDFPAAGRAAS